MKLNKLILLLLLLLFTITPIIHAETESNHQVLVVYSSESAELDQHQRFLDLLIGHFTSDITFMSVSEVDEDATKEKTHLFYLGTVKDRLPVSFQEILTNFNGKVIGLGHNINQLGERFNFVSTGEEAVYSKIIVSSDPENAISVLPRSVITTKISSPTEILAMVTHGEGNNYPLFIQKDHTYYYASSEMEPPLTIFLGEVLHEVFQEDHETAHPAYIRLEDVHPMVDHNKLLDIAKELKKRQIPYMVAVVPVYTNPETGKESYLSDSRELLNVLKYVQDNGGSIVMHGYTHQFRKTETGEGFEFWDVENNMPIYHEADEKVFKKTEKDFDNIADYQSYREEQLAFETTYIKQKLTRGIQELSNYGIYPLAFEAPHYTMSQNGYKVTAEHFSTYVGQVQLSDADWEIMSTSPYYTTPVFLHGMKLLPETIGFVDREDPIAINKMMEKAQKQQVLRDGMIAGFYHPYLGVEEFIELMDQMEQIPGIEWIDLKQMENTVQADHVFIQSNNGVITKEIDYFHLYANSIDLLGYKILHIMHESLWTLASAGFLSVLWFIFYIFKMKIRQKRSRIRRRYRRAI
ncbi:DUF2334 domain-containing protein [Gracilibacillus xinjiangensis]|uniref:DUF2334 domain-containing protein n=1 Tax=Gracilibacillus xinjiangensis TaxID=1193282 RepID=A0ABV8X3T4_9BACI